jgi:hypothetical protein
MQATLLAQIFQVFGDGEHRFVGAVGNGLEGHGRHLCRAGLLAAGVPPFQLDRRQPVTTFGVDPVGHGVDALTAVEVATAIVQMLITWGFRITAEAADIAQ